MRSRSLVLVLASTVVSLAAFDAAKAQVGGSPLNLTTPTLVGSGGSLRDTQAAARTVLIAASEAVRKAPQDPQAWNTRGIARLALGQYSSAGGDFSRAIQLAPAEWNYYANRAFAYSEQDKPRNALQDLDRAAAASPGNPAILAQRAVALSMSGEGAQATETLKQATQLAPADPAVIRAAALVNRVGAEQQQASVRRTSDLLYGPGYRYTSDRSMDDFMNSRAQAAIDTQTPVVVPAGG